LALSARRTGLAPVLLCAAFTVPLVRQTNIQHDVDFRRPLSSFA